MSRAWAAWRSLWFRPVSARGVAVLRIGVGLLLIDQLLALWPSLARLVGPDGLVTVDAAAQQMPAGRWTPLDHVVDEASLHAWMAAAVLAAVLFTLGLGSRAAGVFSVCFQAWLYQRDPWFMNGGDRVLRLAILYLCTVPCGAAWSVEAWLRQRLWPTDGPVSPLVPATATTLIRVQLMAVYSWSGLQKAGTAAWQQGDALYYALSSANYARYPHWLDGPLGSPTVQVLLSLSSWTVLVWEAGFAALVLWPRTRRLALVVGLAFHVGIFATMSVGIFSTVTPMLLLAWLDPGWVDRWLARRREARITRSVPS